MNSTVPLAINNISQRIQSLDILRGAIMVLMAIDHVRVYSGIPAGSTTAGIFFTRWITHFCAPTFVFLAGTAAFLYGIKTEIKSLSRFLLTRGILLVILEITLIRYLWSFSLDFGSFFLAGVIWMLGWCMIILSALVWLKPKLVGYLGVAIVLFQQLFGLVPRAFPANIHEPVGKIWEFIYPAGLQPIEGVSILYVLVPWVGVMAAGYGFGLILNMETGKRNKICLRLGIGMTLLFLIIGSVLVINQGAKPDGPGFIFRLLNQNKYPASQLYLFMTLGPVIALVPYAGRVKGWLARVLSVFGRVPMFYYLMHIPLIHLSALLVNYIREGNAHPEWYLTAPFTYLPEEFRWGLPLLYLVVVLKVIVLYFVCRWYANQKQFHPRGWMKYV